MVTSYNEIYYHVNGQNVARIKVVESNMWEGSSWAGPVRASHGQGDAGELCAGGVRGGGLDRRKSPITR